jgi:hypothetical protein
VAKLVILLALLGLAYWYWSGSREQRMHSAGGLRGLAYVGSSGEDAERVCADKHGLVKRDGQWHKR